jgi:hypothetical protein
VPTSKTQIHANHASAAVPTEASAVERRFAEFVAELQPSGTLGVTLLRRAATLAVRMETCSERELAATSERIRRAQAEFIAPDGVDSAEADRLRTAAGRQAAFDTSKEAIMARRYEAAAERGFFRALKEFRLAEKPAKQVEPPAEPRVSGQGLGSFLEMSQLDDEFDRDFARAEIEDLRKAHRALLAGAQTGEGRRVDVPFAIGRAR